MTTSMMPMPFNVSNTARELSAIQGKDGPTGIDDWRRGRRRFQVGSENRNVVHSYVWQSHPRWLVRGSGASSLRGAILYLSHLFRRIRAADLLRRLLVRRFDELALRGAHPRIVGCRLEHQPRGMG